MTRAHRVWSAGAPVAAAVAAAVAAGVGAALGQAPWGLWPLALIGYALGIWIVAQGGGWRACGLRAWVFGTAHFAVALHWITEPFYVDAAATGWMAPFALILLAAGLALFWAGAGALAAWLVPAGTGAAGWRPLALALTLTGAEALRATVLTGFPWAMPGHVLIAAPALPLGAWLGPLGLTLVVLAGAGLLVGRGPLRLAGPAVWAGALALGALMPPAPTAGPEAAVVRLIQPNAPQHLKWRPDHMPIFFRRGLLGTAATPDGPAPSLVVWPETALPELLERSAQSRAMIADASGPAPVLIGAQRFDETDRPRNAAALLAPGGEIAALYDKHHLVPFGEYLPLRPVFAALGVAGLAEQLAGGYRPGPGPQTMEIAGLGTIFPMICYEAIFPGYIRGVTRPALMVHLTNDAWFGAHAGPAQHLALARLRAAEQGLPLVRAANTGISAAIDARGQVIATLPLGVAGHLDVPVPPALAATPYARAGDWPVIFATILALMALFARRRRFLH